MNQNIKLKYSQEEINQAFKYGDEKVFEYLFNTLFSPLVNYAFKYVANREEAKEIVQDGFIYIWNKRENIEFTTSIISYFFILVKNRSLNFLKSKYFNESKKLEEFGEIHVSDLNTDAKIETENLANILNLIIESLPQKTKLIFNLSRHEELTYKEISKQLDISIKTVEFHISSALKHIKNQLRNHWYLPILIFCIIKLIKN